MSEFLLVFTMIVLSHDKIILTMEKVNLVSKTSVGIEQYQFENTEAGFASAEEEEKKIKSSSFRLFGGFKQREKRVHPRGSKPHGELT